MNPRMTISIDSALAALIKANERIKALGDLLESTQVKHCQDIDKLRNDFQRAMDAKNKELAAHVRLDDPVVKGLVDRVKFASLNCDRYSVQKAHEAALAAYNARLKEVGCE